MRPASRRTVVTGAIALTAAPGLAQAATKPWLDLARTPDLFRAYARMRGRDTAPGLWWYEGTAFGQREGEPQQALLGIEGFSFNRLTVNADGTLSQHMSETGYFKDLVTGAIVDSWVNPMNGQMVTPRHFHSRQQVTATIDSLKTEEGNRPPAETRGRIGPAVVGADTTWITENFSSRVSVPQREGQDPATYPGPVMVLTSMAVFAALTKDVQNKALDFVPATLTFQSISGFLPWMRMGREPGLSVWQLMGRKVRSIDDCPPALRTRIAKDHPGWLENPQV
jgi:hypothetical protein